MGNWITSKEINEELQKIWPAISDTWPKDKLFWCPTYFDLKDALREVEWYRQVAKEALEARGVTMHIGYLEGVRDYDNFALELQADISRYRIMVERKHSVEPLVVFWAFGTAICKQVNGELIDRTVNICKTSDKGFMFIEPQSNMVWVADKNKDTPYFVEIR